MANQQTYKSYPEQNPLDGLAKQKYLPKPKPQPNVD